MKVRWLTEEERGAAIGEEILKKVYRMRLSKADFLEHGFTEGCIGCKALIAGTAAMGHTEPCRTRVEAAVASTKGGQVRRDRQIEHEKKRS